jgi:hypothetical protein
MSLPETGDVVQASDSGSHDNTATRHDIEPNKEVDKVQIVKLGLVTLGADGRSPALKFTLPDDAVSFGINAVGTSGVFFAVDALRNPNGKQLILDNWYNSPLNGGQPSVCVVCLNRVASTQSAHGTLVPNTPAVELLPGEHSFRIYGWERGGTPFKPTYAPAAGKTEVSVVIKRSKSDLPKAGELNLNLHFTGADGLTAATAQKDARLLKALDVFIQIYAQAGISVGSISYRDLDPAFQVVDSFSGPNNDFEVLAKLTADNPPGVNLIFVRELVDSSTPLSGFGTILGISGGIPGPMGEQGTPRSTVLIATSTPPGLPGASKDHLGPTIAHEAAHFLGLFHSSEMGFGQQQVHDHLADTGLNDKSNLMYYDSSTGGTQLSISQSAVLRSNPWVHHPSAEGSE